MSTQPDARRAAGLAELAQSASTSPASESSFREMIDRLPAAIYTTDASGRLTHFNSACIEFSGRTPQLGSDHWCVTWKMLHPDGTPMPHDQCPMAVALKEGRVVEGAQAIAERPDGTRIWFEPYPTPFYDSDGRIVGGINMLVDITERKRIEQLLAGQKRVLERLATGATLEEVLSALIQLIEEHSEGMIGSILVRHEDGTRFAAGIAPSVPPEYVETLANAPITPPYLGPCGRAAHLGEEVVTSDVEADGTWSEAWRELALKCGLRTCYSAPIRGSQGQLLGSFGMYFREARDPNPTDAQLIETATQLAGIAIERKQVEAERFALLAREREARGEAEALNEVAKAVSGLDLEAVVQKATDAATMLTGAKFGAFFYNVTDERGESYMLYTLSGAPREAFEKFGLPRNTPIFAPTFRGEGTVRIADVLADPRYGRNPPKRGMPPGHLPVRSYLAVPVISSSGDVIGGLFFGHPETDVFTEQSERIAAGIALHAAIAIDNARLFAEARQELAERKRFEEKLRRNTQELGRFNRAAVGRELRMIELKKEINALCESLGQPPRYPLAFEPEADPVGG